MTGDALVPKVTDFENVDLTPLFTPDGKRLNDAVPPLGCPRLGIRSREDCAEHWGPANSEACPGCYGMEYFRKHPEYHMRSISPEGEIRRER
jgi:hypothetical protein